MSIRADHQSVNPGTSEKSRESVPSPDKSAERKVNQGFGNSVINHCCFSLTVKFPLSSSLTVSTRRFSLTGNIR